MISMGNKRILLKLSGEALSAGSDDVLSYEMLDKVALAVANCVRKGVEVGIVIGAGNIWRGARQGVGMDRVKADHMGMLATTINCIAMQDALIRAGQKAVVMSAQPMPAFARPFRKEDAIEELENGTVVLFAGGSGCPFFSTDTAAVLRASEIEADAALFAKNIDGVYSADPKKDPTAKKYETLTYEEIMNKQLKAIDLTAAAFCADTGMKILVFALNDPENIGRAAEGQNIGTLLYKGEAK